MSDQDGELAGRSYARTYRASGRADLHELIRRSIERSGARVIWQSPHTRAPFFFGVHTDRDESLGLLIYPFRFTKVPTLNRPGDEFHAQLKLGPDSEWRTIAHPVAFDVAGVDITLMLGINVEEERFVGLDPAIWNPMPLGVSFYAYDRDFAQMGEAGWHTWEVDTRDGNRNNKRTPVGFESRVAFAPHRLLDFARYERRASDLGLDTPLRISLARQFLNEGLGPTVQGSVHPLEAQFGLSAPRILDLIAERRMLRTAVKGGVAEAHLEDQLRADPAVVSVIRRTDDRGADFDVLLSEATYVVECKNVSPTLKADGTVQVETQRTRNSKDDPTSRLYRFDAFDVVAACLFSVSGRWEFRFARTSWLTPHSVFPNFLSTKQDVDSRWVDSLEALP